VTQFLATVVTFVASVAATYVVRELARRFGIIAPPRPDRWHRKPTALLGGVAIWLAFISAVIAFEPDAPHLLEIIAAGTVLAIVGLVDDIIHLKPFVRLVIQVATAGMIVYLGVMLHWSRYELVNILLSVFWLVGITNALNLLDNMDGLAAGIGAISCSFMAVLFTVNGQGDLAFAMALLAAAQAGFLVFNFHPASIFMGDCGSTFLGFVLGAVAMLSTSGRSRSLAAILMGPVLILLIPIFDTTLVTITRKLAGRPASQGGRDHSSHRLVALGMSELRAVFVLYGLATMSGALGLIIWFTGTEQAFFIVPMFVIGFVLLGIVLGKVVIYPVARQAPEGHTVITALTHFSHKRRFFEIMLDVVLVGLAYYGAYLIRWEDNLPQAQLGILLRSVPFVITVEMLMLLVLGVYSGLWRYAGIRELARIVAATTTGVGVSAFLVFASYGFKGPSRAVFILDWLLLTLLISGSRLSFRVIPLLLANPGPPSDDMLPAVIFGAGDGGEILARELFKNPAHGYWPVAFVDDDEGKIGRRIHGVAISDVRRIRNVAEYHKARHIIVSSSKIPSSALDALVAEGFVVKRMSIRIE
jgi:UDP-GlcNAc:undecaprenyl-phosphate/decaprenyl-phosphate GlcNAc-1-phosphate transferase